ncbi:hypothetical protein BH23ACT9_BH23ACT9_00300 [soil metagenome]
MEMTSCGALLATNPAALVDALAALPVLQDRLRPAWVREDPVLTARLFGWTAQARLHLARRAPAIPLAA